MSPHIYIQESELIISNILVNEFIISNIPNLCRSTRGEGKYTEPKIDETSRSAVRRINTEIDAAIDANQELVTSGVT